MELLEHLLSDDPACPRLTVYNESTGARLDFSAQTLDNWASKVGNMLLEELDLDDQSVITVDLPVGWQTAVIVLGALAAGVEVTFGENDSADVLFTSPDRPYDTTADVVLVTDDPFGRGVVETGGTLPQGALDFGPTVRFYGDQFFAPTSPLIDAAPTDSGITPRARVLATGWGSREDFDHQVLAPLALSGSTVVVTGVYEPERLDQISAAEKVTQRL